MGAKKWFRTCRPVRLLPWRELDGGRVMVLRPRLGDSRLGRKLAALLGLGDDRIRLDQIGAEVWKRCDGRTTAGEIAEEVRRRFGPEVEPVELRVQTFVIQMSAARMVGVELDGNSEIHEVNPR